MKRYALYIFSTHYPLGGHNDFVARSDSLEDIHLVLKEKEVKQHEYDEFYKLNFQIVDMETEKVIETGIKKLCLVRYQETE